MGIGSCTFWFSHSWKKSDLSPFLPVSLKIHQLCIIFVMRNKCTYCAGIISIQSGSDNTGAEANINHCFSTAEIMADIIKLVSIKQIQCNTILNIHRTPGEKNVGADSGKSSKFPEEFRVKISLQDIFDSSPFPKYINPQVQWDPDIHPLAKGFLFEGYLGNLLSHRSFVQ